MDRNLLIELLQVCHKYYPVGFPQVYADYPGFKSLRRLANAKLEDDFDMRNPHWKSLVYEAEIHFAGMQVLDLRASPFPSLEMNIELYNQHHGDLRRIRYLCLAISSLARFYTLFLLDEITLPAANKDELPNIFFKRVVSRNLKMNTELFKDFKYIEALVQNHFPEHRYVYHRDLFELEIAGVSTFDDMENFRYRKSASIFELLFSVYYTQIEKSLVVLP